MAKSTNVKKEEQKVEGVVAVDEKSLGTPVTNGDVIYLDESKTAVVDIYEDGNGGYIAKVRRAGKSRDEKVDNKDDYINNLNKMIKVDKESGEIYLSNNGKNVAKENVVNVFVGQVKTENGKPVTTNYQEFGGFNVDKQEYTSIRKLTLPEQRILSSGTYKEIADSGVPISLKDAEYVKPQKTDLHSHLNAVLYPEELVELAKENGASFSYENFSKVHSYNQEAYLVVAEIYQPKLIEGNKEFLQEIAARSENEYKAVQNVSKLFNALYQESKDGKLSIDSLSNEGIDSELIKSICSRVKDFKGRVVRELSEEDVNSLTAYVETQRAFAEKIPNGIEESTKNHDKENYKLDSAFLKEADEFRAVDSQFSKAYEKFRNEKINANDFFKNFEKLEGKTSEEKEINNTRELKYRSICSALSFSPDKQNDFDKLDDINKLRGKFLNFAKGQDKIDPENLKAALMKIGKHYSSTEEFKRFKDKFKDENFYCELSNFHSVKDKFIEAIESGIMEEIEKETGTKIRFLTAISRNIDSYDKLQQSTKTAIDSLDCKYVVGIDYCGEELTKVEELAPSIKQVTRELIINHPGKTIRIHAGENDCNPTNVYKSLELIKEAKEQVEEALKESGKEGQVEYPDVRIGHGVHGLNKKTLKLLNEMGGTLELNPNSNLSFGNIKNTDGLPLDVIIDFISKEDENGVRHLKKNLNLKLVIGTDGPGMYEGDGAQNRHALLGQIKDSEKAKVLFELIERSEKYYQNKSNLPQKEKINLTQSQKSELRDLTDREYSEGNKVLNKRKERTPKANPYAAEKLKNKFKKVEKVFNEKQPVAIIGLTQAEYKKNKEALVKKYLPIVKGVIECGGYIQLDTSNGGAVHLVNEICNRLSSEYGVSGKMLKEGVKLNTNKTEFPTNLKNIKSNMSIDFTSSNRHFKHTMSEVKDKNGAVIAIGGGTLAEKQFQSSFLNEQGGKIVFDPEFGGMSEEYSKFSSSCGQEVHSGKEVEKIVSKVTEVTKVKNPEKEDKSSENTASQESSFDTLCDKVNEAQEEMARHEETSKEVTEAKEYEEEGMKKEREE